MKGRRPSWIADDVLLDLGDDDPVGGDPIITLDIVESAEVVADSGAFERW